jgi:hypothetical protein
MIFLFLFFNKSGVQGSLPGPPAYLSISTRNGNHATLCVKILKREPPPLYRKRIMDIIVTGNF